MTTQIDSQKPATNKCTCFDDYLTGVKEAVSDQIPEDSSEVSIEWQNYTFFLSGGDYSPVNPKVEIEYRKPKKGGGYADRVSGHAFGITANYCVFCGRELLKDEVQS